MALQAALRAAAVGSCVSFNHVADTCYMSNITDLDKRGQSAESYNTLMHLGPIRVEVGVVGTPSIDDKLLSLVDPMKLELGTEVPLSTSVRARVAESEWRADDGPRGPMANCAAVPFATRADRDRDVYAAGYLGSAGSPSCSLELTIGTYFAKRQVPWDVELVHNRSGTTIAAWPIGTWPRTKSTTIMTLQ